MRVPVMDVRVVRMSVDKFFVPVTVGVWLSGRVIRAVEMLMMFVVCMRVLVLHRFVPMFVSVTFCEM